MQPSSRTRSIKILGTLAAVSAIGAFGAVGSQELPGSGDCGSGSKEICGYGLECLQWKPGGGKEPEDCLKWADTPTKMYKD